ncbi:hypothetical protein [Streptomyces sp. ID05-47C]|nr:hypothetical protein [Streptomyces sp. ID05-47C]
MEVYGTNEAPPAVGVLSEITTPTTRGFAIATSLINHRRLTK